jgi:diaminopimelate decarboxylase
MAVLAHLARLGLGATVSTKDELASATSAGIDRAKILLAGPAAARAVVGRRLPGGQISPSGRFVRAARMRWRSANVAG